MKVETMADRRWKYGQSLDEIGASIKKGYIEEGMPPFAQVFSEEETLALSKYIKDGISRVAEFKFDATPSEDELTVSKDQPFSLEKIVDGLTNPWGLEFLPDGTLLVAEKEGILLHVSNGEKKEIAGVPPVKSNGQGGLMDLELHPNYQENGWIYYSYSKINPNNDGEATTAVYRAKLKDGSLVEHEEIFVALPYSGRRYHYGCRMEFDQEGFLYLSVGDRGNRDRNPQNLDNHNGISPGVFSV